MGNPVKNFIISGKVGCGKTTLIKEATLPWRNEAAGFYTEEIREGTERRGFRLVTISGEQGVLAAKGLKSPVTLNKYGVDLDVLEKIGVSALGRGLSGGARLIVIDEIGAMEILSDAFRAALAKCLQSAGAVLATVRFGAQPFTDEIRKMSGTRLATLTRANYPQVKEDVRRWLDEMLSGGRPHV